MPLDPNIILAGLRNQGNGDEWLSAMQAGQHMAAQRLQLQEAQAERDRQAALDRALAQNPGNREAALAQLRGAGHGRAAQAQEMQWGKFDLEQAKLKKEEQKATLEAELASAETRSRLAFTAINAFNQGDVNEAQRVWTGAGMPGGFDIAVAKSEFNKGIAAKDQLTQLLEREKFEAGKKERNEAPLSSVAKLNADLKAGRITQDQFQEAYKDATTKGPMVQVGFSQPFEVTDPNSGKPVLVQQDKQGNLRPVAGYAPKDGGERPLTESQGNATAFLNRAMQAEKTYAPKSNYVPSELENLAFGVTGGNRALSSDAQTVLNAQREFVSGVLRKESGAAISDQEWKNYGGMYFPRAGDSPDVIRQKAEQRKTAMEALKIQAGPGVRQLERVKSEQPAGRPTYTLAQVREVAKKNGISETEVINRIKAKGGTVK